MTHEESPDTLRARIVGKQAALDLERLVRYEAEAGRERLRRELANSRAELLDLKVWFQRSKCQGLDVPEALTIRQLDKWRKQR